MTGTPSSCSLILAMTLCSLGAAAQSPRPVPKSPREFVEDFYKWYGPLARGRNETTASDIALKQRRTAFAPQLARLLKDDSDAQARCRDLISFDFDPFLNTQDPADSYVVGKIAQKGQTYFADVYAVWSGEQRAKPDVTAEFVEKDGHWSFVNFDYPDGGDLLTLLKSPRLPCSRPRPPNER